jgi:hypothetical protein
MDVYRKPGISDTRESIEDEFARLVFEDCVYAVENNEMNEEEARRALRERTAPMSFSEQVASVAIENSF